MQHHNMYTPPRRREWPQKVFFRLWEGVLCTILQMNFAEFPFRDCPKSLVGARGVALQIAEKALFDPFRPPHDVRIHLRSVAQTPFRTVSPRISVNSGQRSRAGASDLPPRLPPEAALLWRCLRPPLLARSR